MLLDGVGGDTVLTDGRRLARLLRAGRWRTAYREAAGQNRYWNGVYPPHRALLASARAAFVPDGLLRRLRRGRQRRRIDSRVREALISAEFAERTEVRERLRLLERNAGTGPLSDGRTERAQGVEHPYLTVGRERYDRVAGAVGIEPRDPFLDLRVISYCLGLPDSQMLVDGWPKSILRRATAGLLPDEVRWRRGQEHLGWAFTNTLLDRLRDNMGQDLESNLAAVGGYADLEGIESCLRYVHEKDAASANDAYHVLFLAEWQRRCADRPAQSRRVVGGRRG
jgi:asparagine synthase (glutamine-hydrolysing)